MIMLLALPIIATVALAHRLLVLYAPSNVLIRHVRIRPPSLSALMGLFALAIALLVAMHLLAEGVASGAPGVLNLVVLVLAWDAIKCGVMVCHTALRILGSRWGTGERRPPKTFREGPGRTSSCEV